MQEGKVRIECEFRVSGKSISVTRLDITDAPLGLAYDFEIGLLKLQEEVLEKVKSIKEAKATVS